MASLLPSHLNNAIRRDSGGVHAYQGLRRAIRAMTATEKRVVRSNVDAENPCAILAIHQVNLFEGEETQPKYLHGRTKVVNTRKQVNTK